VTHGSGGWWSNSAQSEYPRGGQPQDEARYSQDAAERLAWTNVRIETIYRLRRTSYNHCTTAIADRPQGRRPGPHALALLFAIPSGTWSADRPTFEISSASRMFAWTDDNRDGYNVRDADKLLKAMAEISARGHNAGGFDPLTITDRVEPLPRGSQYVGTAISSLGDESADWGSLKANTFGLDLDASCTARLVDGTWIDLSRRGRSYWRVSANKPLGYLIGFDGGPSIPADWTPRPDSMHYWLDQLTRILDAAYQGGLRTSPRTSRHR